MSNICHSGDLNDLKILCLQDDKLARKYTLQEQTSDVKGEINMNYEK